MVRRALLLVVIFSAVNGFAQSIDELKSKYPSVESYAIRPNVLLFARYDGNGQACELSLEKKRNTPTKVSLSPSFTAMEIAELTEELAPKATRGIESKWLGSDSIVVGNSSTVEKDYQWMTITEYGSDIGVEVVVMRWKSRTCVPTVSTETTKTTK